MAEAFKFIHASDFHLEQPIRGLAELPSHLKSVLANAPYEAARKVFDAAIAERVDFVLLSGDLFDFSSSGPRPMAFMLSQFERLAEKGIEVYWCSGSVDQIDRWPASIEIPENVNTFGTSVLEDISHRRNGKVIANIYGIGYEENRKSAVDFVSDKDDVFPIGLAFADFESSTMPFDDFRYWALGGRHRSNRQEKPGSLVAWPGTPQGRSPKESGVHGCHICRIDSNGKLRQQQLETDVVRWLPQKLAINENCSEADLKSALTERSLKISTDLNDHLLLVNWHLTTSGSFNPSLHNPDFRDNMLEWLRDEFGRGERGIWSTQLTIEPPSNLPTSWYEEDTILGEYLRAIGRYQSDDSLNISLHEYLPTEAENGELPNLARVSGERRAEVLRQAALIGIDYLAADRETVDVAEREAEPVSG